jgi:hypothetical protein
MLSARWTFAKAVDAFVLSAALVSATVRPLAAASSSPLPTPPLVTAQKTFYVMLDPSGDKQTASLIAIATAAEFNKAFAQRTGDLTDAVAWVVPEPSWQVSDLVKQCAADPNAVGAVILTDYVGDSTHFWLFWQTQTTTFNLQAQIVSCNRGEPASRAANHAETVAIVSALHNAHGTAWVERHTDMSIPLLSGVAIVALLTREATKSAPTNVLTVATLGTAVLGQAFNKDIPGYSQPVRYLFNARHVGADIVNQVRWLCGRPAVRGTRPPPTPSGQLADLCRAFQW